MCSQDDDPSQHDMTPTPEATEALATALHSIHGYASETEPYRSQHDHNDRLEAAAILAALPPGTVLTTVDDVARRLSESRRRHPWPWDELPEHVRDDYRAEARRLLGVTEE